MAYTKTTWGNNVTPINADNLNNIEDGIGDVDDRVTEVENNYIYFGTEETWEEEEEE